MATLGKNQVFEIKNGDGTSFHNLVLRKSAVESIVMSLGDKISGDVYYKDNSLSVTMHEYITYNGVNYMLVNPPTIVREGIVSDNSELKGMTKYSFVFYHPMCQLANFPFLDVAVTSDETRYLSEGKTFSWIGKPTDFVAKLNKNLAGTEWIVELSSRFPQDKLDELSDVIPFDNATIADACKTFYDTWGVPYVVDKVASTEASYATGKRFKIVMGLPSNEIYENASAKQQNTPFVFQMGHGVGLKNNSRTPRNNKIITRISGYGSENNIPYGYPQVRWYGTAGQAFTYGDHAGVYTDVTIDGVHLDKVISYPIYKGILDGEYVELIKHPFTRAHLMPSVYRTCLFNKISFLDDNGEFNTDYDPDITLIDYYDAVYSSQYPYPNTINLQAPSYESHEFEDEKPELGEAHIISATPLNNDLTPASSWDDSLDDEGNYKQSYFQMVLPQLSFDLYACASITEEMQINMRSGTCLGCTFTVQVDWDDYKRNFYDEEGNFAPNGSQRDLTKYPKSNQGSISLVLQKDNSTFGTLMPNMYQYPKGETSAGEGDGDTFVILGISLPESYIFAAEWRLDADMKSYMLENNVHYFDYPLKFDEDFLFHNENILSQIRPNTVVRFNYAGQTQALFVKQITVKYGDQPLPQYDITLTDNVEVVMNQIGQVAEDVEKLSTLIAILRQSYGKNVWNELAKKLSKTQDDTAAGYITMLKGLQVGANFIPDILGEGGVLRMNNDGKVELVVDTIYARMRAYFDSVVIREYRHESGNRIKSPAQGFNASRVEYIKIVSGAETIVEDASEADFFRCYWRVDDGERKAENQFVIGDLAFCEHSDVANGSLVTKRYWRVVIGRNSGNTTTADGEAWIDLSNAHNASGNPVMTTITYTGQGGTTQTKSVLSFESGSDIPEAHDDICMLGCVTDSTRQGAIIEYVSGTDAPSYQIYQSIGSDATNPYVLTNKNQITIGYNSATGKADMKVYGDAYIGDRNRSTYIEYKQDDGTEQHAPVLNIKAKIQTLPNSTYEGKTASQFVQDNQLKYDTDIQNLTNITNDLQSQIDGEIVSWFYEGIPTLDNAPAVDWDTDTLKERHLGDMYYDVGTGVTSGFAYRFIKSEQGVYAWQYIDDTAITLALAKAAEALGLAGSKAKTYTTANNVLPSAPYNVGDLWLNATGTWGSGANAVTWENEILKCINACPADGTPDISDWAKASKYTDDSAFNGYINAFLNGSGASGDSATAAAIQKAIASALGSGTVVDGGLLLTSLIGMRKYKGSGSRTDVANYDTWAGISGQYDANVFGGGMAAWYGGGMLDKETLTTEQIAQGWNTLRWAKGVDRFDGSGYRADGNLSWDKDGIMTIANVYSDVNGTLVPWSGTTLQYMTNLSNIMPISLVGGVTYLDPQVGFKQLSVLGNEVATQEWVNGNFVTKTWFDNLFRLYNGSIKINVNDTIPSSDNLNIEAMFGFWTKKYISALGQGDDGSTSYTTLAQLNDVTLTNPTANQILVYDGTHWRNQNQQSVYELPVATTTTLGGIMLGYAASGKNYAIQLDANGKAYVNVPWSDTTYTLPTASADTLGGVKIGTTLAIASGVLNLPTTGVTAGTYKRVTVDAYGRVTSGDNTDIDTNTWRNIYVGGVSKVGTGIDTKAINFKAGSNVSLSFAAAGTGSGQSGNANYFDVVISATDTTYSDATQSAAGLMSAVDKKKLDGIAEGANNYSLPLATSGTRGGVKIGYSESNSGTSTDRNYAVQLSSEKMFVNVPWVNTWRGIQDNLTSTSTTDSLSAAQGKALKGYIDTLNGYFSNGVAKSAAKLTTVSKTLFGNTYWTSDGVPTSIGVSGSNASLSYVQNISMSGYIKIGSAYLSYDSTNNAIRVSANANGTGAVNFYAVGGVSALGETADGQAGVGDVTWALLADGTDTRQIALSHLTTSLTTITGGTTDATNKKYAVYKNSSNQLFVDVPWQAGAGTVTSVKVGTTSYTPTNGVISLPDYPTVPTKVSQLTNDSGYITSYTNTWRNIYVSGTEKLTTAITTKGLNFAAGSNVSLSFTAAGSGTGQNANYGTITISATDTTYESKAAASGGTTLSLVTTGEKYSWNNKTYTTSIATDSGTNQLTLAFGTKYKLTAGGTSFVFTMPSNPDNDIKVKINNTNPTTGTWYYPVWYTSTNGTGEVNANDGFRYYSLQGTASALGESYLQIGNSTASGTAGNKRGHLRIYGNKAYYGEFNMIDNLSENKTYTFDTAGTILTSGNSSVTKSGQTLTVTINGTALSLTNSTYTLAGLMGSTAIGSGTEPIYWTGTAFAKTTYKLEKSVPSTAVFTDHYDWSDITSKPLTLTKNTTGFSISGGVTSKTLTVGADYTLGAACAKGVTDNSSNADVTSSDTNLITGRTLYYQLAKKGYTTNTGTVISVATGTGLTGGTITTSGTISINSTYQTYISHGESAYGWGNHANAGYLLKSGGTMTGQLKWKDSNALPRRNTIAYILTIDAFADGGTTYWSDIDDLKTSLGLGSNAYSSTSYLPLAGGTMTGLLSINKDGYALKWKNDKYSVGSNDSPNDFYIWSEDSTARFRLGTNSTERLTVLANGNVGINTTAPSEKLHVNGNIRIGDAVLAWDSTNNAIKVIKADGAAANFYATGGVSALGAGQESGGGGSYLPLSGGTLTGYLDINYNSLPQLLTLKNTSSGDVNLGFRLNNTNGYNIGAYTTASPILYILDTRLGKHVLDINDGTTCLYHPAGPSGSVDGGYVNIFRTCCYDTNYYGMFVYMNYDGTCGIQAQRESNKNETFSIILNPYGGGVGVGAIISGDKLSVDGTVGARGFNNLSDIRTKNRIKDVDLRLDQIAKAPAFEYYWLDPSIDHDLHVGTSAQYWESVLPQVVTTAKDEIGTKAMQYGVAALISAITVARKVMTHEEKIALLETRVSALEKENGEQEMLINSLQEELSKFKAA